VVTNKLKRNRNPLDCFSMLVGWPPDFLRNWREFITLLGDRMQFNKLRRSQGRFAGYRMGRDRSAGLVALADYMLQRTLFQCPNFIY
jgi:hypothetical protein